jgi:hypothetical protein
MPSPFKNNIVLKVEDEEIAAKSRLVPMLHLQVACLSTRSILHGSCTDIIDTLWYLKLLSTEARWSLLHQVLVGLFAPCTLILLPFLNKTHERLDES